MEKLISSTKIHLAEERKQHMWSQQELADLLGTTQNTVSRWELGITTPSPYFIKKIGDLFGKTPQELGFLGNPLSTMREEHISKTTPLWSVPWPRNPFFTGRDALLQSLHEMLKQNTSVALTQPSALHSLGGIGKTQIALEYVYRYASAFTAVLWMRAETSETCLASLEAFADVLHLPQQQEQPDIARAITQWLRVQKNWLLVCDNVGDVALLQPLLSISGQGSLLLTTRLQTLGTIAQQIVVEPLDTEEGLALLFQRTKRRWVGTFPAERHAAQAIVEVMKGLPLALDQAGAYIEETQCTLCDYLYQYQQRQARFVERRGSGYQRHPASVQTTLALSWQHVEQHNPAAAEVLQFCAFFASETIPEEVLTKGFSPNSTHLQTLSTDPWLLDEAIAVLERYALVQRNTQTHTLSLHRLVQTVLQDRLSPQEQEVWRKHVLTALNRVFPVPDKCADLSQRREIYPQAEALLRQAYTMYHSEPQAFSQIKRSHMSKSAGAALKVLLESKGLSQAKVAEQVGVIPKTVGRWMRGECLPQSSLHQRLAETLGITKDQLKDILKRSDQPDGDVRESQERGTDPDQGTKESDMSKLEDAINNAELGWTLNIIGEDQSTKLAILTQELRGHVSQTGDGKQISSGFSYWGISPAIFWAEACRDRLYRVMREGIETFRERWVPLLPLLGSQKYHYVSLGVGTGDKDRHVLNALHHIHPHLYYFPMDMSPEMLRIGVQESTKGPSLERCKVLPIQLDFSIKRNIEKCRSLLYDIVGEEPLLFSLLGNTLANFEEDVQLLKTLTTFLRPQDRLLLEVAYTDVLHEEAAKRAANEYAESRRFQEFVISALFQNTDLHIQGENVLFWGSIEQERAIRIKAVYQNKTNEMVQILLPDQSSVPFPPEDTIRLYLSRKYTSSGINAFLTECHLSLLGTQKTSFENDAARGIELLLLAFSET